MDIRVATTVSELDEIRELRKQAYQFIYPAMDLDHDVLDQQAIVLFTRNLAGTIDSTARLSVEGLHNFPQVDHLAGYRNPGLRLMEWGRFVIVNHNVRLLKKYYRAVYTLATRLGFHAVIMAMKPKDISLHRRLLGVRVLAEDTGVNYDGPYSLACVSWELESTRPEFFRWLNS